MTVRTQRMHPALITSLVILAAAVVVSFSIFWLSWRGAAREQDVARQVPFVISGGLGGLAIVGASLGLLLTQVRRWLDALAAADLRDVIASARALLDVVAGDEPGEAGHGPR